MTPKRLRFLIEACWRRHRQNGEEARYRNVARYLGVTPMTLRRWLRGERPIPRSAAVVMEIFYAYPEIDAAMIDALVEDRLQDVE